MDEYNENQEQQPTNDQEDGAPKPQDYEDYDEFVKARIDFAISKAMPKGDPTQTQVAAEAVAQGVAKALQPQISVMDRINAQIEANKPDDELFGPRTTAVEWIENCKKEEMKAKLNGDEKKAHEWRQRSKWGVDEVEKLGKSEAEKFADDVHADVDFKSINQLFDKNKAGDKVWEHPKMVHDAGIVVARHNEKNKHGLIALPLETTAWGEVLPIHPKNMCQIQLPPQVFESFKNLVYHSGDENTPEKVFKRSWSVLRRLGYAETAKPAFEAKAKKKPDEPETDPGKMTFKEFCKWREGQEPKRGGFVFPKRKNG